MNESTLTLPEAWRRHLHPRRGGTPVPPVKVAKPAVEKARAYAAEADGALAALLTGEHGERDHAETARRHLDGAADPAGAAVVARVAALASTEDAQAVLRTFLDAWVLEHGLAFAAAALVRADSLRLSRRDGGEQGALIAAEYGTGTVFTGVAQGCGRRMRGLLAAAEQVEYDAAVEALAGLRDTPERRLAVSYLVPTRHDWVLECCRERASLPRYDRQRATLLACMGDAGHLAAFGFTAYYWNEATAEAVATMTDGLGAGLMLPLLSETFDNVHVDAADRRRLLEAMALLPTDEAFQALLDRLAQKYVRPALLDAMNRYPRRALRLLAAAADGNEAARELLAGHLATHPETVAEELPGLPAESRELVESVSEANVRTPDAPVDALPRLLVEPPWTRRRAAAKPVVITGLAAAVEPAMRWAEGEREAWSVRALPRWGGYAVRQAGWEGAAELYREGRLVSRDAAYLMAGGPAELVRPLLAGWSAVGWLDSDDLPWARYVIGRYGLDALPMALGAAHTNSAGCARLLLPYLDGRVAALMAGFLDRKPARQAAVAWFGRHGADAARPLLPAALGKAGKERRQAEAALLLIESTAGADAIVTAARDAHGDAAADAVAALLAADPLERLPAKTPEPPAWAAPQLLPQLLLRGRELALPAAATGHAVTMLAMSKPGEMYAGVDVLREVCDPESLAEFSWGVFRQWQQQDAPSKDGWALHQLAWLGDDTTVRRLTPVIRAWPGEGGHKKAVGGLDVLAEIGSEVALLHLHGISQKVKFKALKARAQEKIEDVAEALGLTAEQLADRLVPDFGLAADGSMVLDYGPRRFVVGFDEQLKPYVTDEDGKRRKALPKPGAKDDQELAPAAYQRFADLKKDVRAVAADQVRRLKAAMVGRRRWTPEEFRTLFVDHPLIWHVARRLVWIAEHGDGAAGTATAFRVTAFRVAEDRTLAGAEDDEVTLPETARIGIAHPLDLVDPVGPGASAAAWSEVFADYEILQPFPQLGREVHTLTAGERAAGRLERFEKITVPVHSVLGLVRRGWERGTPLDAGAERWISKPVPGGLHVVIELEDGINVGDIESSGDQTLDYVWIGDVPTDFSPREGTPRTFGELDAVTASEALADLTWLAAAAL
ncbi:DUF4132 domain-containing protein [Spirillospora sp. NPDC029432]|uniref:DUF4132 domain-containing protein n=1 Tax=Spirillospora sp. NPDC029432 TaxID=3154599 RepID=UPI0034570EC8